MRAHVLVALLRRNLLYRRRNLIGSVFEIASPVVMILAVLLLKSVTPANNNNSSTKKTTFYNTTIPNASDAFIPLTFGDYVTAFQAQRKCYRIPSGRYQGLLGITGMPNGQYDWQVPFVRCNDMQCQTVGQNAQPFCEYLILGVAPENANDLASRQRAVRFQEWILQQYPVLNDENKYVLPFRHNFVQLFQSRQDMDAYIAEKDYGTLFKPKLALGVLWSGGNSTRNYKYFLRQNATLFNVPAEQDHPAARTTPDTTRKFDAYAKDDEWCEMAYGAPFLGDRQYSCTGQYLYNGVLTMQNLIGKFILQDSGAWETFPVAEAGIAFVPFPAAAYTEGGFFSNLAGTSKRLCYPSRDLCIQSQNRIYFVDRIGRYYDLFGSNHAGGIHDWRNLQRKRTSPKRVFENDGRHRSRGWLVLVFEFSFLLCCHFGNARCSRFIATV